MRSAKTSHTAEAKARISEGHIKKSATSLLEEVDSPRARNGVSHKVCQRHAVHRRCTGAKPEGREKK